MWALAVGGEAGVTEYLRHFCADLELTFALAGKRRVEEVSREELRPA